MGLIATDKISQQTLNSNTLNGMLEGYSAPAILVSTDYQILAFNTAYRNAFGEIDLTQQPHCYQVSHDYQKPCDQSGEECPMQACKASGDRTKILHIHQTPRGTEHVDVEMLPILGKDGTPEFFVELLKPINTGKKTKGSLQMVGKSPAFLGALTRITQVAPYDAPVLLLGESGTGKELAARAVHCNSPRQHNAMVTLECVGLSDALFESELFGHVKGAFTGANGNKPGLVEMAEGGTLFLDEIGDVPLSMQVKLLRLLESHTYRPVGSTQVKHADFRLICATHKNLAQMVAHGKFREDLYFRINVFPIHIPNLQERKEDIAQLAAALLTQIDNNKNFHLTESALQKLRNHSFKGNIRELRNVLYRAIVLAESNIIELRHIENSLAQDRFQAERSTLGDGKNKIANVGSPSISPPPSEQATPSQPEASWVDLKTAEKDYLKRLLKHHNGDKELTANIAGISLRSLYRKLEDIGI